ncbi:MAG: diaminopimelate epimerase [Dehalococcoidia bacterium]|nr:diaminopimelate epimerase [Dehalococcoidia bacterium]
MHGAGNDFVVFEPVAGSPGADGDWSQLAIEICDRHLGVGADGLIMVLPSEVADRRMRIINADGSEAEMCVNGIRCFAKYCLDLGLVEASDGAMTVDTLSGVVPVQATRDSAGAVCAVRLELAAPDLEPASVGVQIEQAAPVLDLPVTVTSDGGERTMPVALVSMGNPHAVQFVEQHPSEYPLDRVGPLVEHHKLFANRTNFEVVRVDDRSHIDMRVWERGVGETQACGSGACAVVVAAHIRGDVDDRVDVRLPGGTLNIEWTGSGPVTLTGPVTEVFKAEWEL